MASKERPQMILQQASMSIYKDAVLMSLLYAVERFDVLSASRWALSTTVPNEADDVMVDAPELDVQTTEVIEQRVEMGPMEALGNSEARPGVFVEGRLLRDANEEIDLTAERLSIWAEKIGGKAIASPILASLPLKGQFVAFGNNRKEVHIVCLPVTPRGGRKDEGGSARGPYVMISYRLPAIKWSFVHMLGFPRSKSGHEGELVEGKLVTSIVIDCRTLPLPGEGDGVTFKRVSFVNKTLGSFEPKQPRRAMMQKSRRGSTRASVADDSSSNDGRSYEAAVSRDVATLSAPPPRQMQADAEGEWVFEGVTVTRFSELTLRVHSNKILVGYVNTVESRGYNKNPESCLLFGRDEQTLSVLSQAETGRLVVHMDRFLLTDSMILRPDAKVIHLGPMTSLTIDSNHIADNLEKQWHEKQLDIYNKANEVLTFALLVRSVSKVVFLDDNGKVTKTFVPETNLIDPTERTVYAPVSVEPSRMTSLRYRFYD